VQKRRLKPHSNNNIPIMIVADLANTICFEEPLKVATMKSKFITMSHASTWFAAFNKVSKHKNDWRPLLNPEHKQLIKPFNGLSHCAYQDQDDANGFHLVGWAMKQMLVAVMM
jgi:hypothetical protein